MQIYWNKRKSLHKKRVQLPQDLFGIPTWPPWRHEKMLYNIHDVSRGSMSYWWIVSNFHTRGTQRLFCVKFVGRSKDCLEISQTWERLACSHILYSLFKDRRARVWKSKSRGFTDRKRILGIFLGIKGNSNYSLSSEEVCSAWLAMKFSTAVSLCKVNEPSNRM